LTGIQRIKWISRITSSYVFWNISLHLKNIYKEKELEENSTTEVFSVVQKEGSLEVKGKMRNRIPAAE
jgi:hypothetical protein